MKAFSLMFACLCLAVPTWAAVPADLKCLAQVSELAKTADTKLGTNSETVNGQQKNFDVETQKLAKEFFSKLKPEVRQKMINETKARIENIRNGASVEDTPDVISLYKRLSWLEESASSPAAPVRQSKSERLAYLQSIIPKMQAGGSIQGENLTSAYSEVARLMAKEETPKSADRSKEIEELKKLIGYMRSGARIQGVSNVQELYVRLAALEKEKLPPSEDTDFYANPPLFEKYEQIPRGLDRMQWGNYGYMQASLQARYDNGVFEQTLEYVEGQKWDQEIYVPSKDKARIKLFLKGKQIIAAKIKADEPNEEGVKKDYVAILDEDCNPTKLLKSESTSDSGKIYSTFSPKICDKMPNILSLADKISDEKKTPVPMSTTGTPAIYTNYVNYLAQQGYRAKNLFSRAELRDLIYDCQMMSGVTSAPAENSKAISKGPSSGTD